MLFNITLEVIFCVLNLSKPPELNLYTESQSIFYLSRVVTQAKSLCSRFSDAAAAALLKWRKNYYVAIFLNVKSRTL